MILGKTHCLCGENSRGGSSQDMGSHRRVERLMIRRGGNVVEGREGVACILEQVTW
jgi:hypothetical protein